LKAHLASEHSIIEYACTFGSCRKGFPTPSKLKAHQKSHENKLSDIQKEDRRGEILNSTKTAMCGPISIQLTLERFDEEVISTHTFNPVNICLPCDTPIDFEDNVISMTTAATGETTGESIGVSGKVAILTSTESVRLKCAHDGCLKTFSKKSNLRAHETSSHGDLPFVCSFPDCGQRFGYKGVLKRHIGNIHINNKRARIFNYEKRDNTIQDSYSKTSFTL